MVPIVLRSQMALKTTVPVAFSVRSATAKTSCTSHKNQRMYLPPDFLAAKSKPFEQEGQPL
jgi:hypothetical protein